MNWMPSGSVCGVTKTIISTPPSHRASRLSKPSWISRVRPKISSEIAAVMIAATVRVTLRRNPAKVSRRVYASRENINWSYS